jgi:hypothetical protein
VPRPISPFSNASFDPDTIAAMGAAFDFACEAVGKDLSIATREAMANRIVEAARYAERDPDELAALALRLYMPPLRQRA